MTTKIGIDAIAFDTSHYYLDLVELAKARGIDPDKFTIGIGQDQQAVPAASVDVVTMGANAAAKLLAAADLDHLDLVVLGTETGIDASKAGAVYIQHLLGLSQWTRAIEIKQACYGGTAGLMMARDYVMGHPGSQALVIAADIARYGLATPGEVTQGAGAVAMLVKENPRILALNNDSVVRTEDVMDFWRPVYQDTALALGKFSTEQYIHFFETAWARYQQQTGLGLADFAAMVFHLPYTKMGMKALKPALLEADAATQTRLSDRYAISTKYSRQVGNLYTGSLYLALLSLLEQDASLKPGDRIGLFSYGSGAVAEFFSGELQPAFKDALATNATAQELAAREQLSVSQYEQIFEAKVPYESTDYYTDPALYHGRFVLTGVTGQQRHYQER